LVVHSQGSKPTLLTQLAWPSPNATTCSSSNSSSSSHRSCQKVRICIDTCAKVLPGINQRYLWRAEP
jgi:hypothetical protein